jgi:hypothetical protein
VTDIEDRLRSALRARAEQVTPEQLAPRQLPQAAHRHPSRWLAPALVATAAGIAALVAGSMVDPRLSGSPVITSSAVPARTTTMPLPVATHPTTPPVATSTTPPPPEQPAGRQQTYPASTTTTASPPPGPDYEAYAGVRLPLPAGWRLITVPVAGGQAGCLVNGSARPTTMSDCQLTIRVLDGTPDGQSIVAADSPGGLRDGTPAYCPGGGLQGLEPGVEQDVTVDGRTGKYRSIVVNCGLNDHLIQQWVFGERPGVLLVRWNGGAATTDATVASIVDGARLPARTGGSLTDYGHVVGYQQTSSGVTLTFDRAVPRSVFLPDDVNDDPKTWDLPVNGAVLVHSAGLLCGPSGPASAGADGLGIFQCPLSTVEQALTDNPQSVAGAYVWVQYAPDGTVATLIEEYRS